MIYDYRTTRKALEVFIKQTMMAHHQNISSDRAYRDWQKYLSDVRIESCNMEFQVSSRGNFFSYIRKFEDGSISFTMDFSNFNYIVVTEIVERYATEEDYYVTWLFTKSGMLKDLN